MAITSPLQSELGDKASNHGETASEGNLYHYIDEKPVAEK